MATAKLQQAMDAKLDALRAQQEKILAALMESRAAHTKALQAHSDEMASQRADIASLRKQLKQATEKLELMATSPKKPTAAAAAPEVSTRRAQFETMARAITLKTFKLSEHYDDDTYIEECISLAVRKCHFSPNETVRQSLHNRLSKNIRNWRADERRDIITVLAEQVKLDIPVVGASAATWQAWMENTVDQRKDLLMDGATHDVRTLTSKAHPWVDGIDFEAVVRKLIDTGKIVPKTTRFANDATKVTATKLHEALVLVTFTSFLLNCSTRDPAVRKLLALAIRKYCGSAFPWYKDSPVWRQVRGGEEEEDDDDFAHESDGSDKSNGYQRVHRVFGGEDDEGDEQDRDGRAYGP